MTIYNHPIKPSVIRILLEKAKKVTLLKSSHLWTHVKHGQPGQAPLHCLRSGRQGRVPRQDGSWPGPAATLCPVTGSRAQCWAMPVMGISHQQWLPSSETLATPPPPQHKPLGLAHLARKGLECELQTQGSLLLHRTRQPPRHNK